MKKTLNIILLYSFICFGFATTQVSLFNFNSSAYDPEDKNAVNLSNKISDSFIDLMKHDMVFLQQVNFVETSKNS